MINKYENFSNRVIKIIQRLKLEYNCIIKEYDKPKLMKKLLMDNDNFDKKNLTTFLNYLEDMIDSSVIKIDYFPEVFDSDSNYLNEIMFSFYTLRFIRYNIIMSFIMQSYIIFEKELIFFVKDTFDDIKCNNLFDCIRKLKKEKIISKDSDIEKTFDKYRNIINVYKHGDGTSFRWLEDYYINTIDILGNVSNKESSFIFDLNRISVEEICDSIIDFLTAD